MTARTANALAATFPEANGSRFEPRSRGSDRRTTRSRGRSASAGIASKPSRGPRGSSTTGHASSETPSGARTSAAPRIGAYQSSASGAGPSAIFGAAAFRARCTSPGDASATLDASFDESRTYWAPSSGSPLYFMRGSLYLRSSVNLYFCST